MGIYSDIQKDLKEAMDTDLSDAVAILTISDTTTNSVYDPVTGASTGLPIPSAMRCIIVDTDDSEEEGVSSDSYSRDLEVMVLDSEKTTDFKIGYLAKVRGIDYIVSQYKIDPVGATHSLEMRRK